MSVTPRNEHILLRGCERYLRLQVQHDDILADKKCPVLLGGKADWTRLKLEHVVRNLLAIEGFSASWKRERVFRLE